MANQLGQVVPIKAVGAALLQNQPAGVSPTDVVSVVDWPVNAGTYIVQVYNPAKAAWEDVETVTIKQGPGIYGYNGPVFQVRLVQQ